MLDLALRLAVNPYQSVLTLTACERSYDSGQGGKSLPSPEFFWSFLAATMERHQTRLYEFGPFRLDPVRRLLWREAEVVPLKAKAFETLLVLLEHRGRVLEKDELLGLVWPDAVVEENTLNKNISALRRVLGESTAEHRYIVTVPGRGYSFVAGVRELGEEEEIEQHTVSRVVITEREVDDEEMVGVVKSPSLASGSAPAITPAPPRESLARLARSLPGTKTFVWSLLAVAVAGVAFGVYWLSSRPSARTASAPARVVPLTSLPGVADSPTFSPDGKQVAFSWEPEGSGNRDIYVKLINVGEPLRLTTHPDPDASPVWSPDGRYIAFIRWHEGRGEVLVIPALGGPERKLGTVDRGVDWSPDGKYLAISDKEASASSPSLFLISLETLERRKLISPPPESLGDYGPVFSPDGRTLVFNRSVSSGVDDLYLVPASGGEPRRLTFENRRILSRAWMPDGREVIFSSERQGGITLWRVAASGGQPEPVAGVRGDALDLSIARQGSRLAYSQRYSDSNIWRLAVAGATTQGATGRDHAPEKSSLKLIASSRREDSPQFSPDGQKIAFASDRSGSNEIWVCASDGTHPIQLTFFGGPQAGSPRWSPDSQWIAFDARPAGHADIFVVNVNGGQPRRLTTETSTDVVPSWSRDGRWIYFCSNRSGELQIWKLPAAGGEAVQITRHGGFEAVESPDGRLLYYAKRFQDGLYQVPVEGGEESLIPELRQAGYFRYWAVTEAGIFFLPRPLTPHPVINFFSFATRQIRPVAVPEKGPLNGPGGLSVSPDGRWLLYAQEDQIASDLMLIDNFR